MREEGDEAAIAVERIFGREKVKRRDKIWRERERERVNSNKI